MRVESNRPLKPTAARRGERARDPGGASFAEALTEGATPAPAAGTASLAGVGSLLSLQEVDDPAQRRREGFARGGRLLDRLDEIRQGLLAGIISQPALTQLRQELKQTRAATLDPRLDDILAEIDLRAAVELAKLETL
jgi:hypothetical protein